MLRHTIRPVLSACVALLLCATVFGQSKQIVAPPGSLIPGIPFSPAVRSGDLLYVAGTMATDAAGKIVPGNIEAQTRRTLDNIGAILKAGNLDFKDVVQVMVYLTDSRDFDRMSRVYREFFKSNPPVLAVIETPLVLQDGLIEISAIAASASVQRQFARPAGWQDNPLYSRGIRVGDHVFLAGLVPEDPRTGRVVEGDTGAQTMQILTNAKALMESMGSAMSDLTVARSWLADTRDAAKVNPVWSTFFKETPPTRATVRAQLMSPDYRVGMMFWGQRGERQRLGNPNGAFSAAIRVGNTLYTAGLVQGGADAKGDIKAQTRSILTQIQGFLKEAGMDFSNVVNAQVWVAYAPHFEGMNEVYKEFIPSDPPARATVVAGMSFDGLVEIAMIAAK
jgi:enamine deaminase RidA (YjgF/YER057c/UK114 family)